MQALSFSRVSETPHETHGDRCRVVEVQRSAPSTSVSMVTWLKMTDKKKTLFNVFSFREAGHKRSRIYLETHLRSDQCSYNLLPKHTVAHLPLCTRQRWTSQCRKTWSEIPGKVKILKEKRLVVSIPFWRTSTVPSSGFGHLGGEKGFRKESSERKTRTWQVYNVLFMMYFVSRAVSRLTRHQVFVEEQAYGTTISLLDNPNFWDYNQFDHLTI